MKAAPFEYIRPKTVREASVSLAGDGIASAAIAGGQSLLPMLNLRAAIIDLLVDISRLEELKAVSTTPTSLRIGALTSHAAIEDGKIPDLFNGLMRRVASEISYRAIRNHGTIGGSVALADPAADWPGCLMALGASVRIAGLKGTREQPMSEFLQGPYSTSLESGEIILGFDVPRPDAPLRWGFAKVVRKSGAFANSIAVAVTRGRDGPASVVLGAAGPRAIVLGKTGKSLHDRAGSEDALRAVIATDLDEHVPEADAYQRRLHTATILRAIREMRTKA
jgi:aerobic carbon-monoxide dehydrogenase medium subunit